MNYDLERFRQVRPRWEWKELGWWFTTGGVAATLAVLVTSLLPSSTSIQIYVLVFLSTGTLFPLTLHFLIYSFKSFGYFFRKVQAFDELLPVYINLNKQLIQSNAAIASLWTLVGNDRLVEIKRVQFFREQLRIVIANNAEISLAVGQIFLVIDREDGLPMGRFKVIEVGQDASFAAPDGYVDPVWMGYVRRTGNAEMYPPAGLIGVQIWEEQLS